MTVTIFYFDGREETRFHITSVYEDDVEPDIIHCVTLVDHSSTLRKSEVARIEMLFPIV